MVDISNNVSLLFIFLFSKLKSGSPGPVAALVEEEEVNLCFNQFIFEVNYNSIIIIHSIIIHFSNIILNHNNNLHVQKLSSYDFIDNSIKLN